MSIIDDLYSTVAHGIVGIHAGLEPVFGATNGYGWALSVVLLTMAVRLVLFPLFVKQIKSQRTLQMIQPKMKEIREKYKNDKTKMNEELMKLQKEHGNPLLGCLPIFAQIPLFIALFRVLNGFKPQLRDGAYQFVANHGLSQAQAQTIGNAKIFGVPLSAAFNSPTTLLQTFKPAVDAVPVRIVTLILVVIMCATTFLTQKQIMGRNGPVDPAQRTQQRVFLYLAPLSLGVSGIFFGFPVGVLLYWMTTNLWSMGQQFFVLRRMPPVLPLATTSGKERAVALERVAESVKSVKSVKSIGRRAARTAAAPPPPKTGAVRLSKRAKDEPAPAPTAPVRLRQARREALRGVAPAPSGGPAGPAGGSSATVAPATIGTPVVAASAGAAPQAGPAARPRPAGSAPRKGSKRRGGRR